MSFLNNIKNNYDPIYNNNYDPIYNNLFEIKFNFKNVEDFGHLIRKSKIKKIEKDEYNIFDFYLRVDENNYIEPIDSINYIINNNICGEAELSTFNKEGDILFKIFLYGLNFIKIDNEILEFDYTKDDIKILSVNFEFDKLDYVNYKDLKVYNRKKKLKLLEKFKN
ncbi:MAG: hypothetical protein ACOCP8_08360 [archaeon]